MKINDLLNVLDDDIMCNITLRVKSPIRQREDINSTLSIRKCSEMRERIVDNVNISYLTAYTMLNGEPAMLIVIDGVMQ